MDIRNEGRFSRRALLRSTAFVGTAAALPGVLSACSPSSDGDSGDTSGRPAGVSSFPSAFPEVPQRVDPAVYAYDDLTKSYAISLMASGPFSAARPDDPIQKYLQEQFNAEITYQSLSAEDMRTKLALTFTGGDAPDFICIPAGLRDVAASLWDQGQLLAADDILGLMPQASIYVTEGFKKWASIDEELIGIPVYNVFPDVWNTFIRKDFLSKAGMETPTTTDELFAYAEALKTSDPTADKKGPWFMATGGGGTGWGMIDYLRPYFGHPGFNTLEGKINHPMIDGTQRAFLEYVTRLNTAKLLPPDWYTTPWEQLKSRTFNDQLGMVAYPGWNLADETYIASGKKFTAVEQWEPMPALTSADGRGGKLAPGGNPGSIYLFNTTLSKDEGKLRRIAHMIDTFVYPNVNYWNVAQGGGPDIFPGKTTVRFDEETGRNLFTIHDDHPFKADSKYGGLPDWQAFGYTLSWQLYEDKVGSVGYGWNLETETLPRYENFDLLLNLDPKPSQDILTVSQKSEIQFVLGRRSFDDWDAYVEEWKKGGGQELLDQAAEQLNVTPV